MHNVFVAGAFLILLLTPCLLAMQFGAPEEKGAIVSRSEFGTVKTWRVVARSNVDRHPLVARVLSALLPSSNTPGRWAARRSKQWRTS